MLTENERKQFANRIKIELEMNNYGFQLKNSYSYSENGTMTSEKASKLSAIRELIIRLNVWVATGNEDKGSIKYPEANRRIDYVLSDKSISKCGVNLIALSK